MFNDVFGPARGGTGAWCRTSSPRQALRRLPLTIYGDGAQTQSRGYIDDVMEALERYFWRDRVEFADRLNIGNDREATVIALTRYVAGCFPGSHIEHLAPVPQIRRTIVRISAAHGRTPRDR